MADIEVLVMWGANVLHVGSGRKGFSFGELPIVTTTGALAIHPHAKWVRTAPGVARMELPNALAFQVTVHEPVEAPPLAVFSSAPRTAYLSTALSFLFHATILASLALFMPPLRDDDTEGLHRSRLLVLQHLLKAEAERESAQPTPLDDDMLDDTGKTEGGTGAAGKGREGAMGTPSASHANAKLGIEGPSENRDPHTMRDDALREAAEFGMIGLIATQSGVDSNSPTTPWGRAASLGNDPTSARGNLWGDAIGDSFGYAGLSLSGTGEGCGGCSGQGIGIGTIGTIGHGLGRGIGGGVGDGHGHLDGGHTAGVPFIRSGGTQINGRLPPEAIQRVVRANLGRFRSCYANGLRTNPSLEGRVVVKFVIARDGSVEMTADGGSEMADPSVTECVVRGFGNLSFPAPAGGIVTVVYPYVFSPT